MVSEPPSDPGRIFFGAWVTLEDENGQEQVYRIVGPDEFDPAKGWISMDAPMARAMMKKTLDDEVVVNTSKGTARYYVVAIQYSAPRPDA